MSSSPPSPQPLSRVQSPPEQAAAQESALSRLFIAPLTFVSFLLSLALIDQQSSSLRTHYHSFSSESSLSTSTWYWKVKQLVHCAIWRPQEQPYAYIKSPNANEKEGDVASGNSKGVNLEPWHWNTKQKKMMRMQVVDAFEIRKWVAVALLTMAVGFLGVVLCLIHLGVRRWSDL